MCPDFPPVPAEKFARTKDDARPPPIRRRMNNGSDGLLDDEGNRLVLGADWELRAA